MRQDEQGASAPLLLKTAILLQGGVLLLLLGLLTQASNSLPPAAWMGLIPLVMMAVLLVGIWRLRRWGVVGYALIVTAMAVVTLLARPSGVGLGAGLGLVAAEGLALVPAVLYWNRMS